MPWLRHFALFLVFVAALFRPAAAGAFSSAPDAGPPARVGAFELVAATLVGPASAATCGLHAESAPRTTRTRQATALPQGVRYTRSTKASARSLPSSARWGRQVQGRPGHHIVDQTPGNIARFGVEAVHNTGNLVTLAHGAGSIHARISGLYSSIRPAITGSNTLTVRQWLSTQSFEAQAAFGKQAIENVGAGLW